MAVDVTSVPEQTGDAGTVPSPATSASTQAALAQYVAAPQLTQARAPLDDAAAAFATPDSAGHYPVVVLPDRARRLRVDFILGGVIAIVVAIFLDVSLALRAAIVVAGVAVIVAGVFRAFVVPVPMGTQALLLRAGKFYKTVGPGTHFVLPGLPVSHIVAMREIPFGAPALSIPTRDDIRTNIDMVMTFTIAAPEKFVFTIAAPDFDQVCQATCQQSLRLLVREKTAAEVIDLSDEDTQRLHSSIADVLGRYGIEIARIVITHISLPMDFVASREAQGLAAIQRAEEKELHSLETLRQTDRDERTRRRISAQREAIELEAANEVARLERLEKRLHDYPAALNWDVQTQRLDVARALAGNTRAMVQVGPADDIATAMLMHTAPPDDGVTSADRARPRGSKRPATDTSQVNRGE